MGHPIRLGGMALTTLVASSIAARRQEVSRSEEHLFRLINGAPDRLHLPVWMIMQSGSLPSVFVVSCLLRRSGPAPRARAALVAGITVWAGVKAMKPMVGRGRPAHHLDRVLVRGPQQSGLGYPSGHTAVATTLAIISAPRLRFGGHLIAVALAVTTAGARIYVGAHLPLDIVGGAAVGVLGGRAAELYLASGTLQ
ncbi:MAG: phosphatase PAP2 family protein [Acidimicrobiia bacterium]|nr:phosphatase PAP2 family protein [Acidimicrobiia bacterium]